MVNRHAAPTPPVDCARRDVSRLVGGIVEYLHLESIARVLQPSNRVYEPLGDMPFVIDWQLHRDARQLVPGCARLLGPRPPKEEPDQQTPVQPVHAEPAERTEIQGEDDPVQRGHVPVTVPAARPARQPPHGAWSLRGGKLLLSYGI